MFNNNNSNVHSHPNGGPPVAPQPPPDTSTGRQLRDNFNTVIREFQPLVETARSVNAGVQNVISITSFLNRQQEVVTTQPPQTLVQNNSIVIDVGEDSIVQQQQQQIQPQANEAVAPPDEHNLVEAQQFLAVILKYVPFVFILLAKSVFDYHEEIFILIILLATFIHTNSVVKKEATKRHRRSVFALAVELLYISACSLFVYYVFGSEIHELNVVLNLILVGTFKGPLTVGHLLWIVTITDFVLKLATVAVKILLTMLPGRILPFQKRGKLYLFVEAMSQMYRSIATVQPWLNFLLDSYHGPEKIVAVFLSAFYMISKGSDLMARLKLLKTAFVKLLQNVTIGYCPSKEQIQTAGDTCPICHDEYDSPVLLQCRHIFCESCVTTWFDREQTCPLCRAKIVDDPSWRDGSTTYFIQLY